MDERALTVGELLARMESAGSELVRLDGVEPAVMVMLARRYERLRELLAEQAEDLADAGVVIERLAGSIDLDDTETWIPLEEIPELGADPDDKPGLRRDD